LYQKKQQKIREENKYYLATQSLKRRLDTAISCVSSIEEIEHCINSVDIEDVISVAAEEFMLNPKFFSIVTVSGKKLALDARTGQTFNSLGIAHEHLNMSVKESIIWLHGCLSLDEVSGDFALV